MELAQLGAGAGADAVAVIEDGYIFSATQYHVPPIMVIGWVEGPYRQPATRDPYPVAGKFNRAWLLDYSAIYQEMEAMAKSGKLTEADMEKEMTKMQAVLREYINR